MNNLKKILLLFFIFIISCNNISKNNHQINTNKVKINKKVFLYFDKNLIKPVKYLEDNNFYSLHTFKRDINQEILQSYFITFRNDGKIELNNLLGISSFENYKLVKYNQISRDYDASYVDLRKLKYINNENDEININAFFIYNTFDKLFNVLFSSNFEYMSTKGDYEYGIVSKGLKNNYKELININRVKLKIYNIDEGKMKHIIINIPIESEIYSNIFIDFYFMNQINNDFITKIINSISLN